MTSRSSFRFFLTAFLLLAGAGFPAAAGDEALPPADLIAGNLAQCEAAVELLVTDVAEAEAWVDDSGGIGYVQYLVRGIVTRRFKGRLQEKDELSYRFTQERNAGGQPAVRVGSRYVAFLKRSGPDGGYWLFAEAAQFASSPGLLDLLEKPQPPRR